MSVVLVLVASVPLASTLVSVVAPRRVAAAVTVAAGLVSFGLSLALVSPARESIVSAGILRVDALSVVFLLPTGFLYAATAVYSVGYLSAEAEEAARAGGAQAKEFARYSRLFYIGLNAFAWSMLCAPMADGLALLWIAIEVTTVISALLVAIDDTEGATEAAWKYVLIASCGLGIALLATIVMYYAGSQPLGQSYDLAFDPLLRHAAALPHTPVRLAFGLAVVGFGTKVGLFPVHTWLPDAHAEAPTPVSALLSGSLLAVSFYAILRYFEVSRITLGPGFPQGVLLVFGVASLVLAAFSLFEQVDLKRLLAYSSVEHMGILAIGTSFGVRVAAAGVLLHVWGHAAAKGNAFMGAGTLVRAFGSKQLSEMRGGIDRLPWSGPLFLIAVLALGAMPPFGLFRSEFEIIAGGLEDGHHVAAAILIVLVTLAFLGLTLATTRILWGAQPGEAGASVSDTSRDTDGTPAATPRLTSITTWPAEPDEGNPSYLGATDDGSGPLAVVNREPPSGLGGPRLEPSIWMVLPPVAGVIVLVVLGVDPPAGLVDLLQAAASQMTGGSPEGLATGTAAVGHAVANLASGVRL